MYMTTTYSGVARKKFLGSKRDEAYSRLGSESYTRTVVEDVDG